MSLTGFLELQARVERSLPPRWSAPTATLEQYRKRVHERLAEFGFTADFRHPNKIRGAAAWAEIKRGRIVAPCLDSEVEIAIAFHEIGHLLAEPCSGGDHYRDPAQKDWWCCLRCEICAWSFAVPLCAPLPWSQTMHARLTQSLRHYKSSTPGHQEAVRLLDRLASPLRYYEFLSDAIVNPKPAAPTIEPYKPDADMIRIREFCTRYLQEHTS